jgi:hypothetical protein
MTYATLCAASGLFATRVFAPTQPLGLTPSSCSMPQGRATVGEKSVIRPMVI